MGKITYKLEKSSPLAQYVFDFIFDVMGVAAEQVDSKSLSFDIFYGSPPTPDGCRIAIVNNDTDVLWQDLLNGSVTVKNCGTLLPFDIIHAIGALMTDDVHRRVPPEGYDQHGRLTYAHSFQAQNNLDPIPLVNLYVQFLQSLFEERLSLQPIPLWPEDKTYAIGLSHDVDIPDKYAILHAPYFAANLGIKNNLFNNAKRAKDMLLFRLDRDANSSWLFKEIMEAEKQFEFKSTFFFAARNQFCDGGTLCDVLYDIGRPEFLDVFADICTNEFEIGLHASYEAYQASDRFVSEKQRLATLSGTEIKGLRHHFWHMGRDVESTLHMHEQAGFEYDSSIAFNDHLGFRRNVALPFYPWTSEQKCALTTQQLPVFCMDGHLFYHPNKTESALQETRRYIEAIKRFKGVGVIDWHVRTSYPKGRRFREWGKAYLQILEYLSGDPQAWVTSLGEINSWLLKRRQML